ncbi:MULTISPECIES: FGGY family carbohydrate kinase [Streptomycetaceae]|uniref:Carbohydrate kinase FGGY n=1 Tax=Streptantibioticus cattleyicolor (strain ATCC 35852 / DSM 46488 / JCM 4925 / NBRC 14057 / NRRL 8057) TaxID=1003195 RepID=F8K4E3_STREN|nr:MULTISPECIES: FGGY family carbohydrate kinase [Streptomycetaceae]AEW93904.1 carbohydrate kinase FGGY [Streptantibioticus cattleyicolor NRRL 8057 = DSM 46488]MYS58583.1 sugar kinase [Streptomyces sp. SID5468]CCB74251.1 Xylulose kinase [Streptantibioticus cattleyicolor NRRL 8057 = DSM 46488]
MGIVAGLDSSTTGTTVVVCDTDTGAVLRQGYAPHPYDGEGEGGQGRRIEADPQSWLLSLGEAAKDGLLEGVQAIGVSGQQHGMVALDAGGVLVRPAMLWNDKRAQAAAADLTEALGGPTGWAEAVGSVPQAAHPVAKLRWLAQHEPASAQRVAEVLAPHDWLVWQLLGRPAHRTTDRGDASGTGYWSAATGGYRIDLVELALGHRVRLPEVLGPADPAGHTPEGLLISAGTGDNMAAALGLGLGPGDAAVVLGASGTVFAVHHEALVDPSGTITSYADATGRHLPVVQTRNAVRVLRGAADLLGTDLAGVSELALRSTPGAYGLVLLPYLEGERTPQLPHTAGLLAGLRRESMKPEHLARAAVEGMLCGLADALDVLRGRGVEVRRVFLLGPAGELPAVQAAAPALFGVPVVVPPPADYAALGAARQAAWALGAQQGALSPAEPPHWQTAAYRLLEPGDDLPAGAAVRQQYTAVREQTHPGAFAAL